MVGDAGAMRAQAGGLTVSGLQQQVDRDILEGIVHAIGDLSDASDASKTASASYPQERSHPRAGSDARAG